MPDLRMLGQRNSGMVCRRQNRSRVCFLPAHGTGEFASVHIVVFNVEVQTLCAERVQTGQRLRQLEFIQTDLAGQELLYDVDRQTRVFWCCHETTLSWKTKAGRRQGWHSSFVLSSVNFQNYLFIAKWGGCCTWCIVILCSWSLKMVFQTCQMTHFECLRYRTLVLCTQVFVWRSVLCCVCARTSIAANVDNIHGSCWLYSQFPRDFRRTQRKRKRCFSHLQWWFSQHW